MMPNMLSTIQRFEDTMEFTLVRKTIIDGDVAEASKLPVKTFFEGTIQALHPRELAIKPEGERSFKWLTLWTDMKLATDDVVVDENGTQFRVMNNTDWRDGGYSQYQLIEGADL